MLRGWSVAASTGTSNTLTKQCLQLSAVDDPFAGIIHEQQGEGLVEHSGA